jgi:hypothetical protein
MASQEDPRPAPILTNIAWCHGSVTDRSQRDYGLGQFWWAYYVQVRAEQGTDLAMHPKTLD